MHAHACSRAHEPGSTHDRALRRCADTLHDMSELIAWEVGMSPSSARAAPHVWHLFSKEAMLKSADTAMQSAGSRQEAQCTKHKDANRREAGLIALHVLGNLQTQSTRNMYDVLAPRSDRLQQRREAKSAAVQLPSSHASNCVCVR